MAHLKADICKFVETFEKILVFYFQIKKNMDQKKCFFGVFSALNFYSNTKTLKK